MSIWSKYPFLRYLLAYSIGVFSYIYTQVYFSITLIVWTFSAFLFVNIICNIFSFKLLKLNTIVFLGLLFLFGNYRAYRSNLLKNPKHIEYIDYQAYSGLIISDRTEKQNYNRVLLKVLYTKKENKWSEAKGKVLLYLAPEQKISYGDYIAISGKPRNINPPTNPSEFNYANYLHVKGIYHSDYLVYDSTKVKVFNTMSFSLLGRIYAIRHSLKVKISHYIPDKSVQGFAMALLLGIRSDLPEDVVTHYKNTGVTHVLAISGLHVGIIYGVLVWLFGFLRYRKPILFIFIVGGLIWFYAFLTGFSISVARTACMFSILLIGSILKRSNYGFNSLFISALILLILNPFIIFEVGFQFSYAAVIGIFSFYKLFQKIFTSNNTILNYFGDLIAVCLAAQTGVLPLILYYFNQFPVYFLLANLLIIPLVIIALVLGLLFLLPTFWEFFTEFIALLLTKLLKLGNLITTLISDFPGAVIEGITPTTIHVLGFYLIAIFFLLFYKTQRTIYLFVSILLLSFIIIERFQMLQQIRNDKKIILYEVGNNKALSFIKGQKAYVIVDEKLIQKEKTLRYKVMPYFIKHGLQKNIQISTFKNNNLDFMKPINNNMLFFWIDKKILYLKEPISFKKLILVDYLILSQSMLTVYENSLNLESINYKHLILDSSISVDLIDKKRQILPQNFYSVAKQGAWVKTINN